MRRYLTASGFTVLAVLMSWLGFIRFPASDALMFAGAAFFFVGCVYASIRHPERLDKFFGSDQAEKLVPYLFMIMLLGLGAAAIVLYSR